MLAGLALYPSFSTVVPFARRSTCMRIPGPLPPRASTNGVPTEPQAVRHRRRSQRVGHIVQAGMRSRTGVE